MFSILSVVGFSLHSTSLGFSTALSAVDLITFVCVDDRTAVVWPFQQKKLECFKAGQGQEGAGYPFIAVQYAIVSQLGIWEQVSYFVCPRQLSVLPLALATIRLSGSRSSRV